MKKEKAKCRLSCLALIIIDYMLCGGGLRIFSVTSILYTYTWGERVEGPIQDGVFGMAVLYRRRIYIEAKANNRRYFLGKMVAP